MGKKKSNFKCKYCGKPHKAKKGQMSHERACPSRPGPRPKKKSQSKKDPLCYFVTHPKGAFKADCREEVDALVMNLLARVKARDIEVFESSKSYSIECHTLIKLTQK